MTKVKLEKVRTQKNGSFWVIKLEYDEEFIVHELKNKNDVSRYCRENKLKVLEIKD